MALVQWHTEILKYVEKDKLSITMYHGPDRATEVSEDNITTLQSYDVVLTTYATLVCGISVNNHLSVFRNQIIGSSRVVESERKG